MSDTTLTLIKSATQASDPVADSAAFPANVGGTDRYVEAGQIRRSEVRAVTGSGAQSGAGTSDLHVALESATATNYTITGAPTVGDKLSAIVDNTAAHTIVLSGSVTFDGTNQTANLATALDSFRAIARSATRWDIVSNNGVTLSA